VEVKAMLAKKNVPPETQRSFPNGWGELEYVCKKVRYWLHDSDERARALRYRDRLERVLANLPGNEMAIIREEGLALLCELQGKIDEAIRHRSREVELMERLHREAASARYNDDTRRYMLRDRDRAVLKDRRAILERLGRATRRADDLMRS
jgi:hypothetical protein